MPKSRAALPSAITIVLMVMSTAAQAVLIDFENLTGKVEGDLISNELVSTAGVSFSLEGGGFPVLVEVGNPQRGFAPSDSPSDAARHGSFFLTDDGDVFDGITAETLIVSFGNPSAFVSGDLLDVDFGEAWRVEARDAIGTVLAFEVICANPNNTACATLGGSTGSFTTGDRATSSWQISRQQNDIHSLRIIGERTAAGGFGLGFDNFETGVVPEPGTALLLGSGLLWLGLRERRPTRPCS